MEVTGSELSLARIDDAPLIARLSRDEIERGLDWRWRPDAVRRMIVHPETTVLCARCRVASGVVLGGFGIMEFGLERAHLVLLAVQPRLRRQGLARRILHWLEQSASTAGIRQIRLEVRVNNTGAHKFYAALGFQRSNYLPGFYQNREAAYQMTKELGR